MSNRKKAKPSPLGEVAVANVEAEQALLGTILRRDTNFYDIHNLIEASDFYDPKHKLIWQAVVQLAAQEKGRFNIATVSGFLPHEEVPRVYLDAIEAAVADGSKSALASYTKAVVDKAKLRRAIVAMQANIEKLRAVGADADPAEVISESCAEILDASIVASTSMKTLGEYAVDSFDRISDTHLGRRSGGNLAWGLDAMDDACGSLIPGHLHIIGGRPEMGKTALALNVAVNLAAQAPGGFFSLEMKGESVADRALSLFTNIAASAITRNEAVDLKFQDRYAEAIEKIKKLPLYIETRSGLTIEQIRAKMIGMRRRYGCRWFVVDHLHLIETSKWREDPGVTLGNACRILASLAKELNAAMIVLSQVNSKGRDRDNDRPQARDLMYYSSIEPHADLIVFPYRPVVALRERRPPDPMPGDGKAIAALNTWTDRMREIEDRAEIIVAKNRHGPSGKHKDCVWNGPMMRFEAVGAKAESVRYQGEAF